MGAVNVKNWRWVLWIFPVFMLVIQFVPPLAALGAGVALALLTLVFNGFRSILFLCSFTALGHGFWLFLLPYLQSLPGGAVLQRLGLAGYLVLFFLWRRFEPAEENYLRVGNLKAVIKIPGIYKGFSEPVWRFTLIFGLVCAFVIGFSAYKMPLGAGVILSGILFTLVNASLEEILWRGLILPRMTSLAGGMPGLIIASLAFGFYHISLGYPLGMCLIFAIGGFYMGGTALTSKGLAATWIMHIMVNLVMVFTGMLA